MWKAGERKPQGSMWGAATLIPTAQVQKDLGKEHSQVPPGNAELNLCSQALCSTASADTVEEKGEIRVSSDGWCPDGQLS